MYKAMVAGWVAGLVAGWVAGWPAGRKPPPPPRPRPPPRWLAQLQWIDMRMSEVVEPPHPPFDADRGSGFK